MALEKKMVSVVSKPEEMVRVTTDHFRSLFKEREIDVEQGNEFLEHLSRRLPEDIRGPDLTRRG